MTAIWLDLVLVGCSIVLAARALFGTNLFESIVYFVAFGLIIALAWARLDAPDVAIAEAAIGAGITGALLLVTWRRLEPASSRPSTSTASRRMTLLSVALGGVVGGLLLTVWLPPPGPGLGNAVAAELANSGVENPVTAVLLNFRAYDTYLEIGVLLLAAIGVRSLGLAVDVRRESLASSAMFRGLTRLCVPLAILTGAYLLWTGAATPGGAFQAGALWAGALVMLRLAGVGVGGPTAARWPLGIGLAVFSTVAVLCLGLGGALLEYPTQHAAALILVIETAAALSIAAVLFATFSVTGP